MAKILSVEDDGLLLETMEDFLSLNGHIVTCVRGGKEALNKCYANVYDLYLFDINLPDINGIECLRFLRQSGDKTPAIFITSAQDSNSLKNGFLNGADDYVKKPFDLDELNLRINAVLSRSGLNDELIKINEEFYINPAKEILLKNKKEYYLNKKDFQLLCLLIKNRGQIVTKQMIGDHLWSARQSTNEGSVRVYINNLKKLFGADVISNIRGLGYRFEISK